MHGLKQTHILLIENVSKYVELIEKTFVVHLPDGFKGRRQKENKRKTKTRKERRHQSTLLNFLEQALAPGLKGLYFPDKTDIQTEDLANLPQPLSTLELDMDFFSELPKKQQKVIFTDVNAHKYFGLDVLDFMETDIDNSQDDDESNPCTGSTSVSRPE